MAANSSTWITCVADEALGNFDGVMDWLGLTGGKDQGREYLPLNPKRTDHQHGSFTINRDSGAWGDFAQGDKGGDLVSLTAYIFNLSGKGAQTEAADRLGAFLGMAVPSREKRPPNAAKAGGDANTSAAPQEAHGEASRRVAKPKASDGQCVMPVPDDAPAPPGAHPNLGAPASRWEYRDSAGRLLFLVCRFALPDGGKDIRPLSLRRMPSGKLQWRWLGVDAPRPLYGLPGLATRPDAPAMICEGEKAADAAAVLFPDHVAITSPNGAKAADKADWSALAGRRCVVWADADAAGEAYAAEVCKRLHDAKAGDVRRLDTGMFLSLPDGAIRDALPAGWDAADALAEGFTQEVVTERMAAAVDPFPVFALLAGAAARAAKTPPATKGDGSRAAGAAGRVPRFDLDDKGVYYVTADKEGNPVRSWVCTPLEILARVRDPHNRGWGKLVQFTDPDGMTHREIVGDELLSGDGAELERRLRGWGLQIAPKRRNSLLEYLITSRPQDRARVTARTGWHEGAAGLVFVLPHRSIGDSGEVWLFDDAGQPSHNFKERGTLAEWRQEVAARCVGNSRLVFAVSLAFAVPLLHLAEMESGGFHLISNSSNGKTTAMRVAASVCGGPDYMQRWRATDNGLEALAMQHCDSPLLLDELAQLDPKAAGEVAYMLANGSGKARAQRTGGMRDTARWQLLFLSAGEIGLSQHMAEAGKQSKAGQEIRIAEIPADAGAGLGVFEVLHGEANGGDFARALDKALRAHHGVAFPAFLGAIAAKPGEYADAIREARKAFARRFLTEDASGQARRVADRFALVGAAGELATRLGITGWPQGEALKAAGVCFQSWVALRGGEGNAEEQAMIAQVRGFLERHGEARFSDWGRPVAKDDHAPRVINRAGWRRRLAGDSGIPDDDSTEYLILPTVFKEEVCKGFNHIAVAKLLLARGYLKAEPSGGKLTPKYKPPGEAHQRMFHVLPAIFDSE